LTAADNVKVVHGKFNKQTLKIEAGEPIEGGLKSKLFTDAGEKGVPAALITDVGSKKITEVRVLLPKKEGQ